MQCPACESNGGFTEVESLRNFKIWRCRYCGLEFSDPMSYNSKLYEQLYTDPLVTQSLGCTSYVFALDRWGNGIPKGRAKSVLKSHERLAISILQQHFYKGNYILDLGCGAGRFLAALRDSGFRPLGIDVAAEPVEVLRKLGFEVLQGTIENFSKDWPIPDAVTVFDVLEHVPEPVAFLNSIAKRLTTSMLILGVPSPKRWQLWRGKRETSDYPPNHLTRWSETALQIALKRAGYKKIEIKLLSVRPTEITGTGLGEFVSCLTRSPLNVNSKRTSKKKRYWVHPVRTERFLGIMKRTLYAPLAWYLNVKGFSGTSMLAVAEVE